MIHNINGLFLQAVLFHLKHLTMILDTILLLVVVAYVLGYIVSLAILFGWTIFKTKNPLGLADVASIFIASFLSWYIVRLLIKSIKQLKRQKHETIK